ncbi:aldo-keto reductase family 1 member C21-like isoform X2 [Cricetulus griseus]|uniref:Aldo-keto reductase family 1 member C21-like isoform X2 n=1 Tax=Cricetulus griseus TaxID=10029 RepID=A0A9J7FMT9_CRIGR|nr:aldo-keto reductase family 1 member C21-like isoform X2 [Cricetulus griseus]XP_027260890.1 aldo-keto reductase family 1 member C21-like isoform X2 [Cricetulus griseus]
MNSKIQCMKLNDGHFIPVLGFGTAVPEKFSKSKIKEPIKIAIEAGIYHFDCASIYKTEEYVGESIRTKIADGTLRREDIFYTSKVWCNCLRPELVRSSLEQSLKKVQLDYVDLYIMHFPMALKAMEKCKDAGLTKSIGVSNFNRRQLEMILNKPGLKYKPVCNQVECHPYLNQMKLLDFCKSNDIALVAYGVLGTQRYTGWVDQNSPVLLDEPVLHCMAKKYNRTPALIALRYQLQRGIVALNSTFNEEHIKENIQVFEFQLSSEDMKVLDGLNRNQRYVTALIFDGHPNFPFSDEY